MKKKRNNKKSKFLLILLILGISIGFAILTATLRINGIGRLNKATWNIHWENVVVKNGSVSATRPADIVNSDKTLVEYSIVLEKPGDFYEFTVDAKNDGTIDGTVSAISNKLYDENDDEIDPIPSYLSYTVTYSDGKEIEGNHLLKAGRSEKYKVVVEFKDTITEDELPSEDVTLNFKFSVKYDQSNSSSYIRDGICNANIYSDGNITESRYLDICEDYMDDSIYAYTVNDDNETITITGFKPGYTVQQVKSAVRDIKASKLLNDKELEVRRVDNTVISFKDGIWAIPAEIEGYKVTRISNNAFDNGGITAVLILPPTLTEIEDGEYNSRAEDPNDKYIGSFSENNLSDVAITYDLTRVGDYAFYSNKFTSLVLTDTIEEVGAGAFSNMPTLTSLVLSKNIKTIGGGAFYSTELTEVDLPEGLETIEGGAFSATKLKKVIIPDSVTTLQSGSFYLDTVEEIVIGDGLTGTLDSSAFRMDNVKRIVIGDGVETVSIGNTPKLTSFKLGKSVKTITNGSFSLSRIKKIDIPDTVTIVQNGSFSGCDLVEEIYTGGMKIVNTGAFGTTSMWDEDRQSYVSHSTITSLKKVVLGSAMESVTDGSFGGASQLSELVLNDGLKVISNSAFSGSAITRLVLPDSMERVDNGAFGGAQIKYLDTGDGLTEVANSAFGGIPIETLIIGDSVEVIHSSPFYGRSTLTSVTFGKSLKTLESGAFQNCNIETVDLSNTAIETIGPSAFRNSHVSTLRLNDKVQTIGAASFSGSNYLSGTLTLPDSVVTIGDEAFKGQNYSTVKMGNNVTTIGNSAFENNNISTLKLSKNIQTIGAKAFNNNNISGTFTIANSLTSIGDEAFGNNSITSISYDTPTLTYLSGFNSNSISYADIPDSVETIGLGAFSRNTISSVYLPSSVKEIKDEAFYSSGVSYVSLNSVEKIGTLAFSSNALTRISLPSTITDLGNGVFAGNSLSSNQFIYNVTNGVTDTTTLNSYAGKYGSVSLPSSVTKVGPNAFWTTWITGISNYGQVTYFGDYAFGNTSVTSFTAPSGLTEIPTGLFFASKVNTLDLGSVTSIGAASFEHCKLTTVTIPSTVTTIEPNAFGKTNTSNPNLTSIVNNSGRSFNWGSIINYSSGYEFETGTVENANGNITVSN